MRRTSDPARQAEAGPPIRAPEPARGRPDAIHWIAFCAGVLGASAWFQPSVAGSDLWWHLASGREIWAQGLLPPATDPFSYTFGGREWMNHEWLWDALYWGLHQIHPQLVALAHLGVLVCTYAIACRVAWRVSGSLAAALIAIWAAAASAHWFLDLRPHVYTLLLTAVLLATHERPARLWLWPALVVVWTNLHAGFVFGIGAIGLLAVVNTGLASLRARRLVLPGRDWACVGACLVAALLNPWGWRIVEYPLAYLPGVSDTAYHELIEWQPTGFGLAGLGARGIAGWFATFQARFWCAALLAAVGVRRAARERPYLLGLALVAFAMALRSRRFIPLFGICAASVTSLGLAGWIAALLERFPLLRAARLRGIAAATALGLALLLWRDVGLFPDPLGQWSQRDLYPQAAVRYLNALGPPGHVLNYYNWGGYIMLHAPGAKVFIDGRANTLYDEQILQDYGALLAGQEGLRARVDRYRGDVALLPDSGLAQALQKLDPPWTVLYRDAIAILLAPPDSPLLSGPRPRAEQLLADEPQFLRFQGRKAWSAGDADGAAAWFARAIARDPLQVGAYGDLAEVLSVRGDADAARRALERGMQVVPRRRSELEAIEGAQLVRAGQLGPALRALRSSIATGPFSDASGTQRQIENLMDAMRRLRSRDSG